MDLGKACRREAAARKLGGERCVLILSLTLCGGVKCVSSVGFVTRNSYLSMSPVIVQRVMYMKL